MNTFIALWKEKNIASDISRNMAVDKASITGIQNWRIGGTGMFHPVLTYLKLPAGSQPASFAWLIPGRLCRFGRNLKRIWLSIITDISILSFWDSHNQGKTMEQMTGAWSQMIFKVTAIFWLWLLNTFPKLSSSPPRNSRIGNSSLKEYWTCPHVTATRYFSHLPAQKGVGSHKCSAQEWRLSRAGGSRDLTPCAAQAEIPPDFPRIANTGWNFLHCCK